MLRICVFDPEEKAVSIKPFFDFKKKTKNVFDEKIYTKNDEYSCGVFTIGPGLAAPAGVDSPENRQSEGTIRENMQN